LDISLKLGTELLKESVAVLPAFGKCSEKLLKLIENENG